MISVALLVTPSVALIVTLLSPPPKFPVSVLIMKVPDVAPSGTVMLAGTVAFLVSLLCSVTVRPPAGAGPLKVIVPIEVAGAVTLSGLRLRFVKVTTSAGGGASNVVAEAVFDNSERLPVVSTAITA